ncbi:MAG: trigger factor [Propionibacteriaceae bacterium]|jgi:trigger factor|nr:trigger factor [Propionibacteriaceae bacterium]
MSQGEKVSSTVETLSETQVKLSIEIAFEKLQPALDKAYRQIATQVNIPGFRKGKIPRALIDQRYGRISLLQEALNEILPEVYGEALAEHDLTPLGQPEIDIAQLEDGKPVQLTATTAVVPEFSLPDFATITVDVDPVQVSEADVDARLEMLRQRFASYTELERGAATDDVVIIDLSAAKDGVEFSDSDAHGMSYRVGAGGLVDGLDAAIAGLSAGESRTFTSTLVGGVHEGETADITVTVRKVQQQVLPAVDDDFAQLVSEYDTAAEMLASLKDSLLRSGRLDQANVVRDKVLDEVIAQTPFPLPANLVDEEFEPRKQQLIGQLAQLGMSVATYLERSPEETVKDEDEFWAQFRERTERGIRAQIILDKVANARAIGVTQDDLTGLLLQKAAENGTTPEEEAKHLTEHGHMQEWLGDIRRGKAVGLIVGEATVTAGGTVLDMAHLRSDGTYEEPTADAAATAEETKQSTTTKKAATAKTGAKKTPTAAKADETEKPKAKKSTK